VIERSSEDGDLDIACAEVLDYHLPDGIVLVARDIPRVPVLGVIRHVYEEPIKQCKSPTNKKVADLEECGSLHSLRPTSR